MTKIIKLLITTVIALLLIAGYWLWHPLAQNPDAQQLAQASKSYQAQIVRDTWGVPHIIGEHNADTAFGLAFAHAEDDYQTIQETVAATRGVLAQYRGKQAAKTDYLVQLMDVWGTIDRRYAEIPEDVKEIARAYAEGMNLYASQNPQQTWQGLAPFSAEDIVAGFMFKTPFFYGLDKALINLFDENSNLEVALAPVASASAWSLIERGRIPRGSNAIAVSADRSDDNRTRLLVNSHQPMTGPVAWYEAQLHAKQGWQIHGGVFPGTPVILHGFTPNLGWASTVNHIDLWDEYLLTRNDDDPNQYVIDGEWQAFEVREVTLLVKLWWNFRLPVKRKILTSKHGPVIEAGDTTYALRYAGMHEIGQLEQYVRLNQATDFDSFMGAMKLTQLPSINYVYADKDQNIGFIHNAQYPNRLDGWQWQKGLPGDRSELIWQGYRDFSQTPKLINPQSGLVFNANNTPFTATDGPDNLSASDFPASMGLATNETNRSWRLLELNDGNSPISEQQLLQQKFDIEYSKKSAYYQVLQQVLAQDFSDDAQLSAAQSLISKWDRRADVGNRHTAMAISVLRQLDLQQLQPQYSPQQLRAATKEATQYLMNNYGRLDPEWGEVNRLVRGQFNKAVDGGPDLLRAIYSLGHAQDEKAYATNGDTWMALVSWDQSGDVQAKVLHQFGSATLDQNSPHYADQAELFVNHQWRQASFDLETIRANASREYTIGGQ